MKAMRWGSMLALGCGAVWVGSPAAAVVDNSARTAVIDTYNAEFRRVEPPSGWNGDQTSCIPGTTTTEFQSSVVQRVNWYRAQAGLPTVGMAPENTAATQAAALYQSRAGRLSHYIEPGTPCYTDAASEGSMRSNLALGVFGVRAIDLYMVDPGANNTAVGHRQWILSRDLSPLATGDVEATGSLLASNALFVVGSTGQEVTPRDGFVAWPSPGFFPDAVVPERWSFAPVDVVDFSSARVSITGPSGVVPNTIVHARGHIVFETKVPSKVTSDTKYTVSITGASGGRNWTYDVTLIDVNSPPRYVYSGSPQSNTCAPIGTSVRNEIFADDESSVSVTLVNGADDDDNSLFTVSEKGNIRVAADLPLTQTSYKVRLRATDTQGFAVEQTSMLTFADASRPSVLCPPSKVAVRRTSSGLKVTWNEPRNGRTGSYVVYTEPGVGVCRTTKNGCTIDTTTTKKIVVTLYTTSGSRVSDPVSVTVPASQDAPTSPTSSTTKTLASSRRYTLSKIMKIPAGTRTFATSGSCRMSSNRKTLLTASKKGTCRVTVTTSRTVNGKTVKKKTRGTFTVT